MTSPPDDYEGPADRISRIFNGQDPASQWFAAGFLPCWNGTYSTSRAVPELICKAPAGQALTQSPQTTHADFSGSRPPPKANRISKPRPSLPMIPWSAHARIHRSQCTHSWELVRM